MTGDAETAGMAEMGQIMADAAAAAVEEAQAAHRVTLDYTEESVRNVERILGRLYAAGHPAGLARLARRRPATPARDVTREAFVYGAYLGEVIRRRWGGAWQDQVTTEPYEPFAIQAGHVTVFPVNKALKRLTNGREDDVWFFCQRVGAYLGGAAGDPAVPPITEGSPPSAEVGRELADFWAYVNDLLAMTLVIIGNRRVKVFPLNWDSWSPPERLLALCCLRQVVDAEARTHPDAAVHVEFTDIEALPPDLQVLLERLQQTNPRLTYALVNDAEGDAPTAPGLPEHGA